MPEPLRRQVSEGRSVAVEVPAASGRRAFVVVRPQGGAASIEESFRRAQAEGAVPVAESFVVGHYEYDATRLDGWDYDIGRTCHGEARVATVDEAEAVLRDWGFDASDLKPYHQTDAP